jgi:hypothetical protein
VAIAQEGTHTLEYWSVDTAGNVEAHKTVKVNIDKTSPTIRHEFAPLPNANGWFKDDVEVKFVCADALSGIASCGPDRVVSTEGQDQDASGEAVDVAGNRAVDPATVSLDRTPPTIKASADREPNGAGWYDDDVTVAFACGDALSGVDHCPASEVLGEGANQSASGTAVDAAGNTAHARLDGVNVDKTAPKLSGAATSPANGNGWYRSDVVVHWTCSDDLSGLTGDCPEDATVRGEGANLSTSAEMSDLAGNSAHATVDQIAIDRTAPTTAADIPAALESGWYAGPVTVKLAGSDSLSGVESTHYRIDDGPAEDYSGPFELASKGIHEIRFWGVDRAGNVEDVDSPGHVVTLKIDGVPPRITGTRTPAANPFGWNNGPVTVGFDCSDEESGIAACGPAMTLSNEGGHQSAVGTALDKAGNTSTATVDDVNIDLTAPELAGAATDAPNAAGWYRDDVTVHWTATDALSGIDPATVPDDSVIGGEGEDLGAGPVTVADKAGNTTSASSARVKIDRTAPVITGGPLTAPNAYGWYDKAVLVGFECSDTLSGTATCPSDRLVSGNGAGQSVTSDAATDLAGNTAEGITVGGINVDGLAPQTTADNQCTRVNGWCTGSTATVVLTAADQPGLSGVKEIRYSVNGAAEKVAPAASVAVDVPLDGSGEAQVRFHAVDRAGNSEPENAVALRYDNIAPIVTQTVAPAPNAADWNHDDVTVHFSARDNDGGSGVDVARTTPDVTVADETGGRRVEGEAYDVAGNRGSDAVTVKLDRTAPAISGAVVSGATGNDGWYVGPVKVHFTCSDALSGVAVCPDDVTLTANGADQSVTRAAIDFAGNRRSVTVGGISIDQEAPEITVAGIAAGGIYTLGAVPAPSCTAKDGLSGAGTCSVSVTGGQPNGVGTFTYEATATDKAGNPRRATGTYRVVYRFDGFLQPINDTAHQVGTSTSVFKAGSTVPAKFQLKRADGTVVQANAAPVWLTPVKGSATTAPVDESLYSGSPDVSASYRWDASGQQYQYNWSTPAAGKGYYHRMAVQLDDGQTYVVNIGLR